MHVVVDSSGIRIYGEGEWKMRLHGKKKRRTWRKLHIAVNEKTHDIMSVITHANVHDTEVFESLVPNGSECRVDQVTGDGAYDAQSCHNAVADIAAKPCFPPRIAAARHKPTTEGIRLRNHTVGRVRQWGLKKWKEKTITIA